MTSRVVLLIEEFVNGLNTIKSLVNFDILFIIRPAHINIVLAQLKAWIVILEFKSMV